MLDKTRVFATGFSFGAGMAMALACTRADVFRAVAFFSGADLTSSCPTTLTKPIAYYASQASEYVKPNRYVVWPGSASGMLVEECLDCSGSPVCQPLDSEGNTHPDSASLTSGVPILAS